MSPLLRKFYQEIGQIGGKRAAKNLTPAERSTRARAAAQVRWAKAKRRKRRRD